LAQVSPLWRVAVKPGTMFMFGKCCTHTCELDDDHVFTNTMELELPSDDFVECAPGERKTLQVPPDFSIRSIDSTTSTGAGYVSLNEEQKAREMTKLQHMIRDFVIEFLHGVHLDAVLEDGTLINCRCTMDSNLTMLVLQTTTTARQIELRSIQEICSGLELKEINVATPLDDLCVTLVMSDDQCVSFKFADVQGGQYFATCMKVLRLALD